MTRILLVSLLLAVIYSWEELKRAVRVIFYRLVFGKKKLFGKDGAIRTDQIVSTMVVLATLPVSLTYLLASGDDPWRKLGTMALVLLGVSGVAIFSGVMTRGLNLLQAELSFSGLVSPMMSVVSGAAVLPRKLLSRFTLYLSIPPAVGLIMRYVANYSAASADLLPNLDVLILVLVGALFLQIAASLLERYFRLFVFHILFSYYRIALGVVLAWVLLAGVV